MSESRLFKMVYYLLEKGKSTAPELSEKFEVSIRTVYRDIDVIFPFMQLKVKMEEYSLRMILQWISHFLQKQRKNIF